MTFNFDNLKKIYDFIKALPDDRVDMTTWRSGPEGHNTDLNVCGTAACVVGWLPVIFKEPTPLQFYYVHFSDKVGCKLHEVLQVCEPYKDEDHFDRPATRQDALNEMENLAKTYGHTLT